MRRFRAASIEHWPERQRRLLLLVAVATAVVLGSAIVLARNETPHMTDVLYAEDGSLFYADARSLGACAIVSPYAGYLHLVPRIVSAAISVLLLAFPTEIRKIVYTTDVIVNPLVLVSSAASGLRGLRKLVPPVRRGPFRRLVAA